MLPPCCKSGGPVWQESLFKLAHIAAGLAIILLAVLPIVGWPGTHERTTLKKGTP